MTTGVVDRARAIRLALRDLVAERGFHGTSMSAIASAAGVATGTAYVHYASKEELVHATYVEIKRELGEAVIAAIDPAAPPADRYRALWRASYEHLAAEPERARFLVQLEVSPFAAGARELLAEQGDPIAEEAARPDLVEMLVPLPTDVLYALSLGMAVRLVAAGAELTDDAVELVIEATWRAVTRTS